MTKIEYIKSLVATGLTSKEISAKTKIWSDENEPKEVKTEVVADPVDAPVTTTTNEASESSDGKSLSDEEKADAAAKTAAEAKVIENRTLSLF